MKRYAARLFPIALMLSIALFAPPAALADTGFSMAQILGNPNPTGMVSGDGGHAIAYVLNERGVRNIWFAQAPNYSPREVTHYTQDDGQDLTWLRIAPGGKYVVYVRGGDHDSNWSVALQPDPLGMPTQPHEQLWSVATNGAAPTLLSNGDAPAIAPDGAIVAFEHRPDGAIWSVPIAGGNAKQLFFDRGRDSDLQWSPDGKALAFVSDRGDHAFIGIYRSADRPIEYLAPSTGHDTSPRWSPDGTRIAFVRLPGDGGPPQNPLLLYPEPWSIWVADVATSTGKQVWHSGDTLRDSYLYDGIDFVAGNTIVFTYTTSNWPHLYAVSASGGRARLLTPGSFMVEYTYVTPDRSAIVYNANTGTTPGDDDRRHLFEVNVATGHVVALTHGADSEWSPRPLADGAIAFVRAGAKAPPLVELSRDGGAHAAALDANRVPADFPTAQLVVPKEVSFRAPDGTLVHGQLFSSGTGHARKPGVIFVHGGPPRQMLLTWHYMDYYAGSYAVNEYLATHGFDVLSVNYRLGIGYGFDFNNPPHAGPAGASEYQDVLAGARFLQKQPGVDASRIGIWGGSYGGYLTALALARNSDVFKAGVDFHGVHDWTMGMAAEPSKGYEHYDYAKVLKVAWESSPDSAIATWRSPVLLIQGDDDRNVRFHQMVDLVQRLRAAHVPFSQIVIPNEIHGFLRYHSWLETYSATARYLEQHLLH